MHFRLRAGVGRTKSVLQSGKADNSSSRTSSLSSVFTSVDVTAVPLLSSWLEDVVQEGIASCMVLPQQIMVSDWRSWMYDDLQSIRDIDDKSNIAFTSTNSSNDNSSLATTSVLGGHGGQYKARFTSPGPLDMEVRGLVVNRIREGGQAQMKGVSLGSRVLEVEGRPGRLFDDQDLIARIQAAARPLVLRFKAAEDLSGVWEIALCSNRLISEMEELAMYADITLPVQERWGEVHSNWGGGGKGGMVLGVGQDNVVCARSSSSKGKRDGAALGDASTQFVLARQPDGSYKIRVRMQRDPVGNVWMSRSLCACAEYTRGSVFGRGNSNDNSPFVSERNNSNSDDDNNDGDAADNEDSTSVHRIVLATSDYFIQPSQGNEASDEIGGHGSNADTGLRRRRSSKGKKSSRFSTLFRGGRQGSKTGTDAAVSIAADVASAVRELQWDNSGLVQNHNHNQASVEPTDEGDGNGDGFDREPQEGQEDGHNWDGGGGDGGGSEYESDFVLQIVSQYSPQGQANQKHPNSKLSECTVKMRTKGRRLRLQCREGDPVVCAGGGAGDSLGCFLLRRVL